MRGERTLFSSSSGEYGTPPDLFDALDQRFRFVLDPAATIKNAKCATFFTKEDDGLKQDWSRFESVFLNPPYGEPEQPCRPNCRKKRCVKRGYHVTEYQPGIIDWMRKAWQESVKWRTEAGAKKCVVVCLVPARTDTAWWHDYAMKAEEIWFIRGRLSFESEGAMFTAPFPSAVIVFRGSDWSVLNKPRIEVIDRRGVMK